MKFLNSFMTLNNMQLRNRDIAQEQGCCGDITEYWFAEIKHYLHDEWALIVPIGKENKLLKGERDRLKTKKQIEDNNWFPPSIYPET